MLSKLQRKCVQCIVGAVQHQLERRRGREEARINLITGYYW